MTPEDAAAAERSRLARDWRALRDACRKAHPSGPGAAALCVCGAACGGAPACSMLATLRDWVRYIPDDALPAGVRARLDMLRSVVG